jgi:putative ABC transport system ATP-binding protein
VTGATLPDAGEIRLFGQATSEIATETDWLASLDRVGLVSHRAVLLEGMSVLQTLALPMTLQLDPPPVDVRRTATGLASDVGLDAAHLDRPVAGLAPDVRMRIHLARALAPAPAMLLLEHPTATLERTAVRPFADAVASAARARGLAMLVLTGDHEFVEALGVRSLALEPGTGALRGARRWRWW